MDIGLEMRELRIRQLQLLGEMAKVVKRMEEIDHPNRHEDPVRVVLVNKAVSINSRRGARR